MPSAIDDFATIAARHRELCRERDQLRANTVDVVEPVYLDDEPCGLCVMRHVPCYGGCWAVGEAIRAALARMRVEMDARRGRPLTDAERLVNLSSALAEDEQLEIGESFYRILVKWLRFFERAS